MSISISVDVEDIMDQIDDETIKDEFYERNLGGGAEDVDEIRELERAYMYEWQGKRAEAFEILWRYCLVRLNKVA